MTTEEKAKAYDEALEKAKSMIDDLRKGEDILAVSDLESMFPELKESEDERIRKDLIKYLESDRDCQPCQDVSFYDSSIAWLEKQKAAETPQWMIDFLNDIRTASINKEGYDDYDGRREYEGKILAIIRWLEGNFIQQKEQKPVDLEKTVEFNCIGKQVTMTVQQLIDYYIDREGTDVAIECGF